MCDAPEYEDRRQVFVHLYIESQSGCPMCVTHLSKRIEVLVHLYIETQRAYPMCVVHMNTRIEVLVNFNI